MRLVNIKLAGFKSFVEPTVIPVSSELVGIVGPNGCGKSNIIDAVRWVLGESKASALRGDSMQDVIFGGSANRKPLHRASVELIFDNSAGHIVGQWASYTDISIKRILQRDGNSNYYINSIHVRRRDIADIFLGTGVAGRGYAIIEQGMISRIIEAKPQELRTYLEEAAGISRYRERRHETELRLSDARKNMTRLEDIYRELINQREHLETQAEVASHFQTLDAQLQTSQQVLWLQNKQAATDQRIRAENKIQKLESALTDSSNRLDDMMQQLEEKRHLEQNNRTLLQEAQGALYAANAETARIEQSRQHIRENKERLTHQLSDLDQQLSANNQKTKTAIDQLTHWHNEEERANKAYESILINNQTENEELPELENDFINKQSALNNCQRELLLSEQASQLEESHINHANKTIQQLTLRDERLSQELGRLPKPDHHTLNDLQQTLDQHETLLVQNKQSIQETEEQLLTANRLKDKLASQLQLTQQTLTQLNARFKALSTLQQKIGDDGALKRWLTKHKFDDLPRLWQAIQIDKHWENALESVLRERLNSTGFNRLDIIQEWIDDMPLGKWMIHESPQEPNSTTNKATHPEYTTWKTLLSYITCASAETLPILDDWLSHVYVVDNLQDGLSQRKQLQQGEILVTCEGHIFSRYGLTFYSPDTQLHGVLSRQKELEQIKTELTQTEINLQNQQCELDVAQQHCDEHQQSIHTHRQNNQQLQQAKHQLQIDLLKLDQSNTQIDQRNSQIEQEQKEIKHLLLAETTQKTTAESQLIQNEEQTKAIKQQLQQTQLIWQAADQRLSEHRLLVQQTTKNLQEVTFNVQTCQNKIAEIENTIKAANKEKDRLEETRHHLLTEQETLDESSIENQHQNSLEQRKTHEQTVNQARNDLEDTTKCLRELDQARMLCEQDILQTRESINQIKLKEQAAILTEQRFEEQLDAVTSDVNRLLPLLGQKTTTTLQNEINHLKNEITKLGHVNLAALDELAVINTRATDLDIQLQDLNEAIRNLENVIAQIDHETKIRLQETFNTVNNNLDDIFPVIFGGGQAKLILSDGEILDSGLVLTAQPPGKKNSSIHLLSGGEKALTALALIFSLFRLNPAPFCLLDEVDAPLDDTNTNRFCELVKKMAKQTQFLFISHNKITMEMAQQLIGITMQEQGVSRIVAVDIKETIKFGVINSPEMN